MFDVKNNFMMLKTKNCLKEMFLYLKWNLNIIVKIVN
jgi:hypothetical protein